MSGIGEDEIAAYQRDGAVCLRGVFRDWVEVDRGGDRAQHARARALAHRRACAPGEPGSFFDDYCNWERIPEFRADGARIRRRPRSPPRRCVPAMAQFFHDHVLVKEPGTQKATPWHQDIPYYFVDGAQTVSFWIPIDPVPGRDLAPDRGLASVGHSWVMPVRWLDQGNFYPDAGRLSDRFPTPTASRRCGYWSGRWSPATPSCSISAPCTARAATAAARRRRGALAALGRRRRAVRGATGQYLAAVSRSRHACGAAASRGLVSRGVGAGPGGHVAGLVTRMASRPKCVPGLVALSPRVVRDRPAPSGATTSLRLSTEDRVPHN